MQANQLEKSAHSLLHCKYPQIAALGVKCPQARDDRAKTGAVYELDLAHVHRDLATRFQAWQHLVFKLLGVARIQGLHWRPNHQHIANFFGYNLHFIIHMTLDS